MTLTKLLLLWVLLAVGAGAAPLNPPEVIFVPTYYYPNGAPYFGPWTQVRNWSGKAGLPVSKMYPFSRVPRDGVLKVDLFARDDSTEGWGTALQTQWVSPWAPALGVRWANSAGVDRLVHLDAANKPPVFNKLGYSGGVTWPNPNSLVSRMDWPSYYFFAAAEGPAASGGRPVDAAMDFVIVERRWQSYNTANWSLSGGVSTLSLNAKDSFIGVRAGTPSGPVLWNSLGLFPGPAGSVVKQVAGRESVRAWVQPFEGNPLGMELCNFFIDCWPQPSGTISYPAAAKRGGVLVVDGSTTWGFSLTASNIFPGGKVYATFTGTGSKAFPETFVPGIVAGPTPANSVPTGNSMFLRQLLLIPPVPRGTKPDGTYQLSFWHDYNGVK